MNIYNKIIPIAIVATLFQTQSCKDHTEDLIKASFTMSTDLARVGDTIYFHCMSSDAMDYSWDFGDGNYSTEKNPWHIYDEIGNYSVYLSVTNAEGSDVETKRIRISFWSNVSNIPTGRGMHASSVVDGKIYVVSGGSYYGQQGALNAVEMYDPEYDTWTVKSNIPIARQCITTSVVNGKIYAIGGGEATNNVGYVGAKIYTTVEEYDPATDTWSTKSSMPIARYCHSASVVDNKIYIIGGSINYPWTSILSMDIYDPLIDVWSSAGSIPRGMIGSGTAVVNGKIYVIGGELGPNGVRVDEFDPQNNSWIQKADMPTWRNNLSCTVLDGKIYAIGGEDEAYDNLSTVEVYDPTTNTWEVKDPIINARWTHSSCTVNGKIYVIGGLIRAGATNKVEVYFE